MKSYQAVILNGGQLMSRYGGGGSEDAKPLGKQSRSAQDGEVESDDSDAMDDDFWHENGIWDDKRGIWRRRQQQSSDETVPENDPGPNSDLYGDLEC